jgi:uncharacterized protein YndB with AHSA1/START domain
MAAGKGREARVMNQTTMELRGDREIVIERTFNGPPRIVFEAWTKPELVRRWWAPKALGVSMIDCEADVRPGGTYRYVFDARGRKMAFSGKYHEVAPPSRLVYTELFEPAAGGADPNDEGVTITVTFEERGSKTHVVSRSMCPSKNVRDAIISSDMESGMRITMDQLDELVASLSL